MARIAGVNIPTNKRVIIALQYIHGIGPKFAQEIVDRSNAKKYEINRLGSANHFTRILFKGSAMAFGM